MDDLREQLARAFAAEHGEHVAAIRQGLAAAAAGDAFDLRDVFRRAHSLKGAARAVDRADIEELAHLLEGLLADAQEDARGLGPVAIADARALVDAIEDAVSMPAGEPEPTAAGEPAAEEARGDDLVRVSTRHVERLAESMRALQGDLEARSLIASDLRDTRAEIEAIRQACFAPRTRLIDVADRLARLLASSNAIAARRIAADAQVERTAATVKQDATQILLAPASLLAAGQERLVRTLAAEAGKEAELVIDAEGVEADRRVLQALRDPLNHLLRNAISHGVQPAAGRRAAGKPERARLALSLRVVQGRLLLAVEDDGPGPDVAAIVAAARARGAIGADAPDPPEEAALRLVFEHGLSTSGALDRLSGRGVGLAIVAEAAHRLDGEARILRAAGGGTRVEIDVPATLTRRPMLLAEAGGQTFAIPTRAIARAIRFVAADLVTRGGRPMLPVALDGAERLLPVVTLAAALGLADAPIDGWAEGLVLRDGAAAHVIVVEALSDVRLLAYGEADAIAADLPLILGAASIGESRLALILAPEPLLDRVARGAAAGIAPPEAAAPARQRTILVVDDSITTRTLERGILEGRGYRVLLSVDGIDGLETLRDAAGTIDLVVADVEMPRLDGFGLLSAIRNDPALADIPVVMMTSRNSPDDIQRGLDLGASAYVTKQEFEQGALLATIGRLI